ncbi:MAG: hypothetical protein ACTSVU_04350 [Promethearchaeota archaeon]
MLDKNYPDGITFYDLQKIKQFPASMFYRKMKKLEEEGYLEKHEKKSELGRPKYVYFKTLKGIDHQNEIKSSLKIFLSDLKANFGNEKEINNFNTDHFLKATFCDVFKNTHQRILNCPIDIQSKLGKLNDLKSQYLEKIKEIDKSIEFLKLNQKNSDINNNTYKKNKGMTNE